MNKWTGIGRLTRDPELRYSPSGVAVTTFTVAVDRRFKNTQGEKETDFIRVKVFKQLAELCANYLAKGRLAGVTGELQISKYTDKDGNTQWSTDILADNVDFLSPKSEDSGAQQGQGHPQGQSQQQQTQTRQQTPPPAPGSTQYPPGSMPPPPGYTGSQGTTGTGPASRFGHEVNLDDDIPF